MKRFNPIRRGRIVKSLAIATMLIVGIVVLLTVSNLLLSSVVAFVISYILTPVVASIERSGLSRKAAVTWLFTAICLFTALTVFLLMPMISVQILTLKSEMPGLVEGTQNLLMRLEAKAKWFLPGYDTTDFNHSATAYLSTLPQQIFSELPKFLSSLAAVMMMAPFLAFFMLLEGRKFTKRLLTMVPNNIFELSLILEYQINRQLSDFIRARLLEAAIVGAAVWVGLAVISFPYGALLGIFAGLTNLIPYIGPIIGAIPALLIALVSDVDGLTMLLVAAVYVGAQVIDNMIVIPLIVAKIVDLHPILVMVVILIGAQTAGILGMIISIPVACIIKLCAETFYHHLLEFRV